jgi:hypothetical protein
VVSACRERGKPGPERSPDAAKHVRDRLRRHFPPRAVPMPRPFSAADQPKRLRPDSLGLANGGRDAIDECVSPGRVVRAIARASASLRLPSACPRALAAAKATIVGKRARSKRNLCVPSASPDDKSRNFQLPKSLILLAPLRVRLSNHVPGSRCWFSTGP